MLVRRRNQQPGWQNEEQSVKGAPCNASFSRILFGTRQTDTSYPKPNSLHAANFARHPASPRYFHACKLSSTDPNQTPRTLSSRYGLVFVYVNWVLDLDI